jgi:bacillithiol biosynthesis cysteine-adding enzyme BshC
MARLFVGTELVLLDPQDPALMRLAQPLIERELDAAAEGEAALERRNAEIAAAGFTPQVEHLPGDTNLFLLDARQRRRKIARDGAGFSLRQTGERYTRDELLNLAARQPERFVPGVMLRPVYQNTLFPPAAFIGGGAEIAYRAQATAVYEHHGQRMAPAFHRASATLLPAKSAALLAELGLELADCYCVPQDLEARAVAQSRPEEIERALAAYRALLLGADAELQALAGGLDATLPETFDTLRGNLERHVEKLEKKLTSALKHRHEALLRRAGLVQRQVYPQSAPQERVLGCLSFLPRAGSAIIARLLDELAPFSFTHRILVLD